MWYFLLIELVKRKIIEGGISYEDKENFHKKF